MWFYHTIDKKKIVAFKGTQKNNVNMFCESDTPRLAIYISLGHRDTFFFFFSKNHKKFKNLEKKNKSLYRQEVPGIHFGWFLDVVFATRDLQNDMFCHALGTERELAVD